MNRHAAPGTLVADRYRILRTLGEGGMGVVVAARDELLGRDVAVKFIHRHLMGSEEIAQRFRREAYAAARLQSPHIVTVHDIGTAEGGEPFIVQELLEGYSLQRELEERGKLEPARAVSLALQACQALQCAHAGGVIHRDIKPANLFVTRATNEGEHLIMLDFGIAKLLEAGAIEATATGQMLGTPFYMSLEQILTPREVTLQSDIYCLGATLFHLLSGQLARRGESLGAVLQDAMTRDPLAEDLGEASPLLNSVLRRCLAKRPGDRYESASDMEAALRETPEAAECQEGTAFSLLAPASERLAPSPRHAPASVHGKQLVHVPPYGTFSPEASGSSPFGSEAAEPSASMSRSPVSMATDPPIAARTKLGARDLAGLDPQKTAPLALGASTLHDDIVAYVRAAGLETTGPDLLQLRRTGHSLPNASFGAIVIDRESDARPAAATTVATVIFKERAKYLYDCFGTVDIPYYVIAILTRPPAAGVYLEWHELWLGQRVRVLPATPDEIREATRGRTATQHLTSLIERARHDPFRLEGPVARELDFHGWHDLSRLTESLCGHKRGFTLFGLEKWGVTSALVRIHAELESRPAVWLDFTALPRLSAISLLGTIQRRLAADAAKKLGVHSPAIGNAADEGSLVDALSITIEMCHEHNPQEVPIVFLDRIEGLLRGGRCPSLDVEAILRILYMFSCPPPGSPRLLLAIGGSDQDIHLRNKLTIDERTFENPLWRKLDAYYAAFLGESEHDGFFRRLGYSCGLVFDDAAIAACYAHTGGHKYLSRLLGSRLAVSYSGKVNADMVEQQSRALASEHSDYLDTIFRHAPEFTQTILRRLVAGPASTTELIGIEDGAPVSGRLEAIRFASNYGFIREKAGYQHLTLGLLAQWLRIEEPLAAEPRPSVVPRAGSFTIVLPGTSERAGLRRLLEATFDTTDLMQLVEDMGSAPKDVIHVNAKIAEQVMDVVDWAAKHGRLDELGERVRNQRPHVFRIA